MHPKQTNKELKSINLKKEKKKKDILIYNPRPTTMIHQMTKTNNYRIMKIPWILAKAE